MDSFQRCSRFTSSYSLVLFHYKRRIRPHAFASINTKAGDGRKAGVETPLKISRHDRIIYFDGSKMTREFFVVLKNMVWAPGGRKHRHFNVYNSKKNIFIWVFDAMARVCGCPVSDPQYESGHWAYNVQDRIGPADGRSGERFSRNEIYRSPPPHFFPSTPSGIDDCSVGAPHLSTSEFAICR